MARWAEAEGAILSLGSVWIDEERAYNFSLYAWHAERVTLLLFGEVDAAGR
jgi:pullulanase/glycogen debranching enzyme